MKAIHICTEAYIHWIYTRQKQNLKGKVAIYRKISSHHWTQNYSIDKNTFSEQSNASLGINHTSLDKSIQSLDKSNISLDTSTNWHMYTLLGKNCNISPHRKVTFHRTKITFIWTKITCMWTKITCMWINITFIWTQIYIYLYISNKKQTTDNKPLQVYLLPWSNFSPEWNPWMGPAPCRAQSWWWGWWACRAGGTETCGHRWAHAPGGRCRCPASYWPGTRYTPPWCVAWSGWCTQPWLQWCGYCWGGAVGRHTLLTRHS